jgi:REP element-mobilizing transposase RayT
VTIKSEIRRFVAKYRRHVFDGAALERLRELYTAVCRDFDARLVAMDGEDGHVHPAGGVPATDLRFRAS